MGQEVLRGSRTELYEQCWGSPLEGNGGSLKVLVTQRLKTFSVNIKWQVFCYPAPVQPQLLFSYSQVFFIIIINYINLCCRNLFKLRKTHPFSLEMLGSWNFQEEQRRNSFPENIKPFLSFTWMALNTRFLVHFSVGFFSFYFWEMSTPTDVSWSCNTFLRK